MLIYYQEYIYTQNLNMIFIVLDFSNNKHQQLRILIFDVETKQQLVHMLNQFTNKRLYKMYKQE